jgi:serine protease Do
MRLKHLFFCFLIAAAPAAAQMPDFTHLMRDQGRAVVNVSTTFRLAWDALDVPLGETPEDELLRDFLRRQFEPFAPRELESRSLGSGFIVAEDCYVITNSVLRPVAQRILH